MSQFHYIDKAHCHQDSEYSLGKKTLKGKVIHFNHEVKGQRNIFSVRHCWQANSISFTITELMPVTFTRKNNPTWKNRKTNVSAAASKVSPCPVAFSQKANHLLKKQQLSLKSQQLKPLLNVYKPAGHRRYCLETGLLPYSNIPVLKHLWFVHTCQWLHWPEMDPETMVMCSMVRVVE